MSLSKVLLIIAVVSGISILSALSYVFQNYLKTDSKSKIRFLKSSIGVSGLVLVFSLIVNYFRMGSAIGGLLSTSGVLSNTLSAVKIPEMPNQFGDPLVFKIIFGVYSIGLLVNMMWLVSSYLKMRKILLDSLPSYQDGISFRTSSQIDSPFSFGFLNPQIFLPGHFLESRNKTDLNVILKHEQTHLGHRDPQWKLISLVGRSVLFFLPTAYYLHRKLELEMEIQCDEATIQKNNISLKDYGLVLIETAAELQTTKLNPLISYMSETNLKRRIYAMTNKTKNRPVFGFLASLVLVFVTIAASAVATGIHKKTEVVSVVAEIYYNGALISTPRIFTVLNEATTIQTKEGDFDLKWQITASDSSLPPMPNGIELNTTIEYMRDNHIFRSSPRLVVKSGEPASIQVGNSEGNTLEIRVTVDKK
jgi:beta-lactamase regulating signal transducer with metallopeptidase domain